MAKVSEFYLCELCGNLVEVFDAGDGDLVCCGQSMTIQKENSVDASKEKHVPMVELEGSNAIVRVGSAPHPMEAKHYIMWIELCQGNKTQLVRLEPSQNPEALFVIEAGKPIGVRAFCNLHGLWKGA
ncbi:MAG: desulfoferrodoxin [Thermoguttaceae bacterium]